MHLHIDMVVMKSVNAWQAERELNEIGFQVDDLSARLEEADSTSAAQVSQSSHL